MPDLTGKSHILQRCINDSFNNDASNTVGIDFGIGIYNNVKFQIWDTSGRERYRSLTTAYYRGVHIFLVVYDVRDKTSFTDVSDWISRAREFGKKGAKIILVGNACDCSDEERAVTKQEGQELATNLSTEFIEVSAKTTVGINELMKLCSNLTVVELTTQAPMPSAQDIAVVNAYVEELKFEAPCTE